MRTDKNKEPSFYKPEDLAKLKAVEIEISQEIFRICKAHEIPLFAIGGTALGAIRHHGFIPWDDDMDFGMLRKDYDRFLLLAEEELGEGFFVLNYSKNRSCPFFFTKICKRDTIFLERETKKLDYPHCIFVDLFPFDNVPDGPEKLKWSKRIHWWNQLFKSKVLVGISATSRKRKSLLSRLGRLFLHITLLPVSRNFLYRKLDHLLREFNQSETPSVAPGGDLKTEAKKEWLLPSSLGSFENIEIPLPANSHAFLSQVFGDYTKLPPVEMRIPHSPLLLSFESKTKAQELNK